MIIVNKSCPQGIRNAQEHNVKIIDNETAILSLATFL